MDIFLFNAGGLPNCQSSTSLIDHPTEVDRIQQKSMHSHRSSTNMYGVAYGKPQFQAQQQQQYDQQQDFDSLNDENQSMQSNNVSNQGKYQLQDRLKQVKNVFSAIKKHLDNEEETGVAGGITGQSEIDQEEMLYNQ